MSIVKTYAKDAHEQLQKSQMVARKAHEALRNTHLLISRTTNASVKCEFVLVAIEQQLDLLNLSLNSIQKWIEKKQHKIDKHLNSLSKILEKLSEDMEQLQKLSVEKSLLNDNELPKDPTLASFVSAKLLEDLQLSYDSSNKWSSIEFEDLEVFVKDLNNSIKLLISEYQNLEKIASTLSNENMIENTVEENSSLEKELAELLDSLTDHYDQTLKGVEVYEGKLKIDEKEKNELFDVLANDYEQVPEIVSDVESIANDIINNCSIIDKNLSNLSLFNQCKEFLNKLIEFDNGKISPLLKLLSSKELEIKQKIKSLSININDATNLTKDLLKFKESYYSLILELDRRRIIQKKMVQILEEARSKVDSLQIDDFHFRKNFWNKNGDFLPKDLYNDEKESNPLCSINVNYNSIPKINESTINNAKAFLQR